MTMTKTAITALAAVHLAATLWHGDAHTKLDIGLPIAKSIFVFAAIIIAPVAAAGLIWTRYVSIGLWLFVLAMLGALLFGAYHHYVWVSPDNVGHLPAGSQESHSQFISSAAVIALLELASALYGAFSLGRHLRRE
jgi:hypothetical protein